MPAPEEQHTWRAGAAAGLAVAAAVLFGLRAAAGEEEIHQRYFEGLRARGLYRLAETYCLSRLADERLGIDERARLTVELSRTFAEHAVASDADQGTVLWEQARKVAEEFLQEHPETGHGLLLKLQLAEVDLAQGEQARWRWEASPQDAQRVASSRELLQRALHALETLEKLVERGLSNRKAAETAAFSSYRLRGLRDAIRYRQAKAWLNLMRCAPPGSADAVDALAQAIRRLQPLIDAAGNAALVWNSRIELVECYRLKRDYERAMQLLQRIEQDGPPEAILHRAFAARARILLADAQVDRAVEALGAYRDLLATPHGEVDLAYTEALLRQWEQAAQRRDPRRAEQARRQVTELLEQMRQRGGGYWSRRGELLLAGHLRKHRFGAGSALLAESAQRLYRLGQTDEALEMYRRAAAQAKDERRLDEAFELEFIAAGVLLRSGQWESAARRYTELAQAEHARAGEAQLLGAYAWGRIYTSEPSPERLRAYEAALAEHLQRFADDPTAAEVHWLYGRLLESQQQWDRALKHYAALRNGQPRYAEAVLAAGRCYERLRSDSASANPDLQAARIRAERFLTDAAHLPERGEPVSVAALAAAVRLARAWIEHEPPRYAQAEDLLRAFVQAADASVPETQQTHDENTARGALAKWHAAARQWHVLVLAALGHIDQAEEQLATLSSSRPRELLELIEGLSDLAADGSEQLRGHLGRLQLAAARLLEPHRDALGPEQQFRLDVLSAHAMAYSGQPRRALDHFSELAQRDPENVALHEARAELLLLVDDEEAYRESLDLWRSIESKARSGSSRWYRAKYHIALSHFKLGSPEQCRKVIEVTRLLHPELGGASRKKRFLELLEQCRKKNGSRRGPVR